MEHVRAFQNFEGLAEMQQYLAKATVEFSTSVLYSPAADANIVNLELRKSQCRTFQDKEMFDLVDAVVHNLSSSDPAYSYSLRRDDITETRYEKDGHCFKHTDFLSVTSNLVQEFTLLLCVTPQEALSKNGVGIIVKGGETLIYPYASSKPVAFDTTTPGYGVLFRKDLEHAGNKVMAGVKHILIANLLATKKQISQQVLFVTFPRNEEKEEEEKDSTAGKASTTTREQAAVASLRNVASQDSSYALPVDCLKGTMLEAHVRFMNSSYEQQQQQQQADSDDDDADELLPPVVTYNCTDFSYEEFGTIVKILLRSYVNEQALERHAACIEFFGPFLDENLLVNLAVEQKKTDGPNCTRFVKPGQQDESSDEVASSEEEEEEESWKEEESSKATKKHKTADNNDEVLGHDLDVIVCENESRTKVVNQYARQLGFDNYVPFKMVFVQGYFKTEYRSVHEQVSVTPAACLVGDYNHVFAIQKCGDGGVEQLTLAEYHTKRNYWKDHDINNWETGNADSDVDEEEDDFQHQHDQEMEFYSKGRGLGLKLALGKRHVSHALNQYVVGGTIGDDPKFGDMYELQHFSHFLDSDADDDDDDSESGRGESEVGSPSSLFHRDKKGRVTFTAQEAEAASNFIASMNLDERVKAGLQKKRFELPQKAVEIDEYYCNDSTYGNMNILCVTGVVRLDSSVETEARHLKECSDFDAWPVGGDIGLDGWRTYDY